jgi:hypothetical protein
MVSASTISTAEARKLASTKKTPLTGLFPSQQLDAGRRIAIRGTQPSWS